MSIIHDALRKVETSAYVQSGPVLPRRKKSHTPLIVYILLPAVIVGAIYTLWSLLPKDKRAGNIADAAVRTDPAKEAELIQGLKKRYLLNGVFFSDGTGYALINNQIVNKGDLFEGMRILLIFEDSVMLDKDGVFFLLNTHHT